MRSLLALLFLAAVSVQAQQADLRVTKSGPAQALPGSSVTYTVTVTNGGPDAAVNVELTDTIPGGMTFSSHTENGGICSTPTPGSGGVITCTTPLLAAGGSATYTFKLDIPPSAAPATSYTNVATVRSDTFDPNEENNSGVAVTTTPAPPQSDASIVKTGSFVAPPGGTITYTIEVRNAGPDPASPLTWEDTITAPLTFASLQHVSGVAMSCSTPAIGGSGPVACTHSPFAVGAVSIYRLSVNVPSNAGQGTTFQNAAFVTAPNDPNEENNTATVTTVISSADVSVSKTGPANASAGDPLTYTITVANAGPHDALSVTLSDPLPAGATFVSFTQTSGNAASCSPGPNVSCFFPSLLNGASATFTLVLTATQSFTNTATVVASDSFDPNTANNSSSVQTTIAPVANLAVTKTAPANVTAGMTATYTINVSNAGPSAATSVQLTDVLPANTTFASIAQPSGPAFSCTTPAAGANGTVTCTIATLANGASAAFTLVLNVASSATGTVANTATISAATSDPASGNNTSTGTSTVVTSADLAVTKSGPATAGAGSNINYALTLTNNGPSDAQSVTLTDALPAATTFVSLTQTSGPTFACTTPAAGANGTITCSAATLVRGATAAFTLVANIRPDATGSVANTATRGSSTTDPNTANDSATVTTTIVTTDLAIAKNGPATVISGGNATYTITAANNGSFAASNVNINDVLGPNLRFVSLAQTSGPTFTCTTPAAGASGAIDCNLASFASGASAAFTLTVNVTAEAGSGSVVNTATISSSTADPSTANNTSSTSATVVASSDIRVTKSAPATAPAGSNLTYTIDLTNAGPSSALNASFTDVLPANTTFVSLSQTGGLACTTPAVGATGTINCFSGLGFPVGTVTFTVVVRIAPTATGPLVNTVTGTSVTPDPNPANNTSTATTNVTTSADLSVAKTGPPSTSAGGTVSYMLNVANAGPSVTSATLTDVLPANTTFASLTQTAGPPFACTTPATGATGTINCTTAAFNPGSSALFTLVLNVSPAATTSITNTATIAPTATDPAPANNTSSVTTPVGAIADLSLTKNGPATIAAGANATYTISLTNNGPANAANVAITDTLPAETTFVSLTQTAGPTFNCTTPAAGASGTVNCTIASLAAGATATFNLVVRVSPTATGPISNSASATSTTGDPTPGNSFGTSSSAVTPGLTDLAVTKSASATTAPAGSNVIYTIVATNNGPATASGTTVTDVLPAGTTLLTASSTQGSCTGTTTVVCTVGTLAPGASATISLLVRLPQTTGPVANTATITAANADANPANNTATVTVEAVVPAVIPTASTLGLTLLALTLAALVVLRMR